MRALAAAFCVLTLELVAYVNAYVANLKGATVDAENFLRDAAVWVRDGEWTFTFDVAFYTQFVGVIFAIVGESEFIVAQVNIAALLVACHYFHRICELLTGASSWMLTVPFLLWPSMVPRATTALREPLLILGLVLTCYFLLQYGERGRTRHLLAAIASLALGALFHKAYAVVFAGLLAAVALVLPAVRGRASSLGETTLRLAVVGAAAATIGATVAVAGGARGLVPLVALLSNDTETMQLFVDHKTGLGARATYDAGIDLRSPLTLAASLPRNWTAYNFYPYPWRIRNAFDAYAAAEGVFRAAVLVMLSAVLLRRPDMRRPLLTVALLHVLVMAVWAAGTANYGTASRHHLTTNWIFLVYLWCFIRRRLPRAG